MRVNPADTPVIMLLTSARVVPHIARARFDSSLGAIVTAPSAIVAALLGLTGETELAVAARGGEQLARHQNLDPVGDRHRMLADA